MVKIFYDVWGAIDNWKWQKAKQIIERYPYVLNLFNANGDNILLLSISHDYQNRFH